MYAKIEIVGKSSEAQEACETTDVVKDYYEQLFKQSLLIETKIAKNLNSGDKIDFSYDIKNSEAEKEVPFVCPEWLKIGAENPDTKDLIHGHILTVKRKVLKQNNLILICEID
jgi:hypothetical protein